MCQRCKLGYFAGCVLAVAACTAWAAHPAHGYRIVDDPPPDESYLLPASHADADADDDSDALAETQAASLRNASFSDTVWAEHEQASEESALPTCCQRNLPCCHARGCSCRHSSYGCQHGGCARQVCCCPCCCWQPRWYIGGFGGALWLNDQEANGFLGQTPLNTETQFETGHTWGVTVGLSFRTDWLLPSLCGSGRLEFEYSDWSADAESVTLNGVTRPARGGAEGHGYYLNLFYDFPSCGRCWQHALGVGIGLAHYEQQVFFNPELNSPPDSDVRVRIYYEFSYTMPGGWAQVFVRPHLEYGERDTVNFLPGVPTGPTSTAPAFASLAANDDLQVGVNVGMQISFSQGASNASDYYYGEIQPLPQLLLDDAFLEWAQQEQERLEQQLKAIESLIRP